MASQAVKNAYLKVDADLARVPESMRTLRTRRSPLSPINALPPEVLAIIFEFIVRREIRCNRKLGWLKPVAHVCRHWRQIAFSCPSLWSTIDHSSVERTEMMLSRAKMVPLTVLASPWQAIQETELPAMDLILSHISRISSLRLFARCSILEKLVDKLKEVPAPMLTRLLLSNDSQFSYVTLPEVMFGGEETPRLEYVSLTRCCPARWSLLSMLKNVTYFAMTILQKEIRPKMDDWLGERHIRSYSMTSSTEKETAFFLRSRTTQESTKRRIHENLTSQPRVPRSIRAQTTDHHPRSNHPPQPQNPRHQRRRFLLQQCQRPRLHPVPHEHALPIANYSPMWR